MEQFDYIVVGGGSPGCVLASRLSEDPETGVLLAESGRRDSAAWIGIPATFFKVIERGRDVVVYTGEESDRLDRRKPVVIQGHVIGGGSSVNTMVYIRGHARDYDRWAQDGNRGWSYADVLPVFRDLENNMEIANAFHGTEGEVHVSGTGFRHPLSRAFIKAAQQIGIPHNPDFNGATQQGVGFYQTTTHDGRRWSAATAFPRKAGKRPNLTIRTRTRVTRILFDGAQATGVEVENGARYGARRETVLCAGAVETPRLLQLSGVGEAGHLRSHGIEVVRDLSGVGANYQDHPEVSVRRLTKCPVSLYREDRGFRALRHLAQYLLFRTGPLTSNLVESGGFVDVSDAGVRDLQLHVLPASAGRVDRAPAEARGLSINPCVLRPRSRLGQAAFAGLQGCAAVRCRQPLGP